MKTAEMINPKDRAEMNRLLILPFDDASGVVVGPNVADGSNTVS